jgi:3-oxoacyl-[acyl-carrier protein] reductase
MSTRPVAVVTGAGRGIGRAIARALSESKFDVCAADIDESAAARVGAELNGTHAACDISDLTAGSRVLAHLIATFGRVDCLVNNAGIGAVVRDDLLDLVPENFDRVMSVNLRGTLFFTQAVARWMTEHPTPDVPRSIITVTSISAALASPERTEYCVSKAGLAMFLQALALRLAPTGISVFDVRPGIIRTDMTAGVSVHYDRMISEGRVPAGRWGEVDDVARVVASLASGTFAFSTGSVIEVGGGLGIQRL